MTDAATLVTRVSEAARDAFTAYCERRASTVAEQLRHLVAEALSEDRVTDVGIAPRSRHRGELRIELRLKSEERRLLAQLAKEDGVTAQQWFIARLVDARLKRSGRFVHTEDARRLTQELEQVVRAVLGMATNLNQVARALNARKETERGIAPERLLVLAAIEKDLMAFVHRAHAVLEVFDNPRELKPAPKQNPTPITRALCEKVRKRLDAIAAEKIAGRSR